MLLCEEARKPASIEGEALVMIEGGHVDPYLREFQTASRAFIDWFKVHL